MSAEAKVSVKDRSTSVTEAACRSKRSARRRKVSTPSLRRSETPAGSPATMRRMGLSWALRMSLAGRAVSGLLPHLQFSLEDAFRQGDEDAATALPGGKRRLRHKPGGPWQPRLRKLKSSIQRTVDSCQGTNSLSPYPSCSLLVSSPDATRRTRSKICCPISSMVSCPSATAPQFTSMSSCIRS